MTIKASYEKTQALMKERGVSGYKVAKELGFSSGFFSEWKNGKSTPKIDKINAIADYLGVPVFALLESPNAPVFNVAAGEGSINWEYTNDSIDDALTSDEYSFARVRGDSMLPVLEDGDIVKVHHQSETEPSDFTVVKVDGESATVKHVEIVENGVWLRAENKDVYEDKFFTIQEVMTLPVTIIGKAVEVRRAL